jgi:hypothetical protein
MKSTESSFSSVTQPHMHDQRLKESTLDRLHRANTGWIRVHIPLGRRFGFTFHWAGFVFTFHWAGYVFTFHWAGFVFTFHWAGFVFTFHWAGFGPNHSELDLAPTSLSWIWPELLKAGFGANFSKAGFGANYSKLDLAPTSLSWIRRQLL